MTIDVVTFNGEYDMLEIRLSILDDYVDQFVIVEADETFSGKPKPLYYEKNKERYAKWADKIRYHVVTGPVPQGVVALADGSPNVPKGGAHNWHREFCQKERIKEALTHLEDDDVCFIGDVDEIWEKEALDIGYGQKLRLRVYSYYLNNASSEEFYGGIVSRYGDIRNGCLNHMRTAGSRTEGFFGWHFTSMGGYDEVKRKLSDSYTRESYWTEEVESSLEENVERSRDFLGRGFAYFEDEIDLPKFLLDNRNKYQHLFK